MHKFVDENIQNRIIPITDVTLISIELLKYPGFYIYSIMPTIRDNKFRIVLYALEIYSLIGGEFQVKDHSITSGQPTSIKNGDTLLLEHNEFNFRVGRKKSGSVAKWFNQQCDTSKCTTFGHPAGDLNFAFLGTLRLKLSYKGKKVYTVIIDDVLIAQGRSGSSNNWWFGCKSCQKITGQDEVESRGITEYKNGFRLNFSRGRNSVNTVVITKISFLTWMKNINDDKLLSQINIPGTHDSGTYKFKMLGARDYVKTQSLSIREQLDLGIRYLDIRCRHVDNAFQIYHGDYDVNLNFDEVLDQCTSFLSENPSESIVLLVSESNTPKGSNRAFTDTFLISYVSKTKDYWYGGKAVPRLKDARRKLFLLYRFDFLHDSFGIDCNSWRDNARFEIKYDNFTLAIQDEYNVSYGNKERAINSMVESSKQRNYQYWYLNYISLAASFVRGTINDTSIYTNRIIYNIVKNQRDSFLGTVIMDYPESIELLTSDIIGNNDYF